MPVARINVPLRYIDGKPYWNGQLLTFSPAEWKSLSQDNKAALTLVQFDDLLTSGDEEGGGGVAATGVMLRYPSATGTPEGGLVDLSSPQQSRGHEQSDIVPTADGLVLSGAMFFVAMEISATSSVITVRATDAYAEPSLLSRVFGLSMPFASGSGAGLIFCGGTGLLQLTATSDDANPFDLRLHVAKLA